MNTTQKTRTQKQTIDIPASVYRLARQLKKNPQELAERIMRAGIEAMDDAIGNNCAPDFDPIVFSTMEASYGYSPYFTITGIIERMPADELADCQKEADDCEQPLQEIVCERATRCANMELLQ